MKVAFCTQDMQRVDAHFGWAKSIVKYEVDDAGYRMAEAVQFEGSMFEDGNEDKLVPKLDAILDCAIVYVAAVGASAAARIVAKKIHPVKVDQPEVITDILDRLVKTLNTNPPPWLRKALGKGQERTFDFEDDDDEE
ncbi:MAG TPA: nitrogen fixation protein NifX [Azospirillaceae bacterium]|nr:nitrogen fixation protein NifX [Azospirillaceae bacterium]